MKKAVLTGVVLALLFGGTLNIMVWRERESILRAVSLAGEKKYEEALTMLDRLVNSRFYGELVKRSILHVALMSAWEPWRSGNLKETEKRMENYRARYPFVETEMDYMEIRLAEELMKAGRTAEIEMRKERFALILRKHSGEKRFVNSMVAPLFR